MQTPYQRSGRDLKQSFKLPLTHATNGLHWPKEPHSPIGDLIMLILSMGLFTASLSYLAFILFGVCFDKYPTLLLLHVLEAHLKLPRHRQRKEHYIYPREDFRSWLYTVMITVRFASVCIWRLDGKGFRTKRKSMATVRTHSQNGKCWWNICHKPVIFWTINWKIGRAIYSVIYVQIASVGLLNISYTMSCGADIAGDTLGDSKGTYYGGRTLTGKKFLPVLEIHGRTPSLVRLIRTLCLRTSPVDDHFLEEKVFAI